MSRRNKALVAVLALISLVFIILGSVFIAIGKPADETGNTAKVTARVVGIDKQQDTDGDIFYYSIYAYDYNGEHYESRDNIGVNPPPEIGIQKEITINADDPGEVANQSGISQSIDHSFLFMGILFLVIGLIPGVIVVSGFVRRKTRDGHETTAPKSIVDVLTSPHFMGKAFIALSVIFMAVFIVLSRNMPIIKTAVVGFMPLLSAFLLLGILIDRYAMYESKSKKVLAAVFFAGMSPIWLMPFTMVSGVLGRPFWPALLFVIPCPVFLIIFLRMLHREKDRIDAEREAMPQRTFISQADVIAKAIAELNVPDKPYEVTSEGTGRLIIRFRWMNATAVGLLSVSHASSVYEHTVDLNEEKKTYRPTDYLSRSSIGAEGITSFHGSASMQAGIVHEMIWIDAIGIDHNTGKKGIIKFKINTDEVREILDDFVESFGYKYEG